MRVLLVHAFMGVWNERDACTRFGEAFSGCDARESPYTAVAVQMSTGGASGVFSVL